MPLSLVAAPAAAGNRSEPQRAATGAELTGLLAPQAMPQRASRNSLRIPGVRAIGNVSPQSFGIHSYTTDPLVSAGAFRLNCAPRWNQLHVGPGKFKWGAMEDLLSRSERFGIKNVLFTFCGTPTWAARKPLPRPDVIPYWGKYGSAAPANMSSWREFVNAFVIRFGSRISAYEAWNEATSPYLWQGSAAEMAEMTKILPDAVRAHDPTGIVVSADSQTAEQSAWFNSFFPAYMKQLARRGWPVDAVSIHTYAGAPDTDPAVGIVKRASVLQGIVAAMRKAKVPRRVQLWDTETNYLGKAKSRRMQQALIARTYLDSWRFGVERTYWYMWQDRTDKWLGVQMKRGATSVPTYNTLARWTVGARFSGCVDKYGAQLCRFKKSGRKFTIAYTSGLAKRTLPLRGKATVCDVHNDRCSKERRSLRLTIRPVKISGRIG